MNPRIVCAANRDQESGLIVIGLRHFDEFMRDQMDKLKGPKWRRSEQGFVDQFGNFYNRKEALEIAEREGQIIRRCGGDEFELFSENLY